jgi:TolB-like protein
VIVGVAAGWLLKPASSAGPGKSGASSVTTSLAVLPFTNLTRREETEPFVDGIHDDLLTQLSKIDALRVISRTSVQEYRNTTKNIRAIATELGVQRLLPLLRTS